MPSKRREIPPDPGVAQRIQAAVEHSGRTARSIALELELNPSSLSQWMTGTVAPSEKNLRKFAELLGEDAEWLMCKKDTADRGVGLLLSRIVQGLDPARRAYILGLPEAELRRMIDRDRALRALDAEDTEKS